MRRQATVYFKSADTSDWLAEYAGELGLDRSEVLRLLIERERVVGWLRWSRSVPDPEMGRPDPLAPAKKTQKPRSSP